MRTWVVLVLAFAACRQSEPTKSSPPPVGSGSARAPGSAADPWSVADAAPVAPVDRRKRAEAAIARAETILPKLAAMRELPMSKPVPAEYQTTEDFRAFIRRELAKEMPPARAANLQAALLHLGLYTKAIDLPAVLEQTMATQAAAYYDPGAKKFFVVMVPDNDMMLDTISAHELTHALQDEHFDLAKFLPPTLDDDAGIARRFIAEGDATFAMFAYLATDTAGPDALPKLLKPVRSSLEQMATSSTAGYAESLKAQAAAMPGLDADMKKAMESLDELPPMIVGPMIDSYLKGALVAITAYEAGGWKAVDALYRTPPASTEQVLHPATKLIGKREEPRRVTLPKLEGTELTQNVIGELQWSIYFQQWKVAKPEAAVGWGGDRYAVQRTDDGALVGYLATTWDTPEDAREFHEAFLASLAQRFPTGGTDAAQGVARPDRGKVFVRLSGSHVFIVDGAADSKALDAFARGAKIQ